MAARYHRSDVRKIFAVLAAAACTVVAGSEAARQQLRFTRCAPRSPLLCAQLSVPLDRSGAIPGRVTLALQELPARRPHAGVLLAIAGGPGQSSTAYTAAFARWLQPALTTHALVVVDLRGTGGSGFLSCPQVNSACEASIPGIHDYTTRDNVEDIEAVRNALGTDRLALYGVSYGTKVAEGYAKRYPQHVESMVLDSVLQPDGWDFYERSSYKAVGDVLGDICAAGRCAGITDDLAGDVAALAARAVADPVRMPTVGPDGRPGDPLTLTPRRLYDVIVAGASTDPVIRAELPGAVHAARDGDWLPLSRLVDAVENFSGRAAPGREFSDVVFQATTCEEIPPLWWRTATTGERVARLNYELESIGETAFAPFGAASAEEGTAARCLTWSIASTPPTLTGTGPPDVPVLLLNGVDDALTPISDAKKVAAQYPHARLVEVPDAGHAVLADTRSHGARCARRAVEAFFTGRLVQTDCGAVEPAVLPRRPPATSLADVAAWPSLPGNRGRIVRALVETLQDAHLSLTSPLLAERGRGLRGGTLSLEGATIQLAGLEYVGGVTVTGDFNPVRQVARRLTVATNTSRSTLSIAKGVLSGTLAGTPVRVPIGRI
jgi:pimeloyl-ACP methyl ester carboxylesterase